MNESVRYEYWRRRIESAHNVDEVRQLMADYAATLLSEPSLALPPEAQAQLFQADRSIAATAFALTHLAMRYDRDILTGNVLFEIAHTFTKAAERMAAMEWRRLP